MAPLSDDRARVEERARKEAYVRELFDAIAEHYDLMNLVMSLGLLRHWQRVFRAHTGLRPGDQALDVATGTAELALIMAEQVGPQGRVWGVDLAEGMVEVGRRKVARSPYRDRITLQTGNALELPFEDGRFDCVASGFALRNFADLDRALREMARVTRPGGRVVSLEISHPRSPWIRGPFRLWFERVVPVLGRLNERRFAARHRGALPPYRWLPESLRSFPDADGLAGRFRRAGLEPVYYVPLTGGVVCVHVGRKPG